jgi:hypothetical protein
MTNGDGHELDHESRKELQGKAQRVWKRLKLAGLIAFILCIAVVALFGGVAYRSIGGAGIMITIAGAGVAAILLVRHLEYH